MAFIKLSIDEEKDSKVKSRTNNVTIEPDWDSIHSNSKVKHKPKDSNKKNKEIKPHHFKPGNDYGGHEKGSKMRDPSMIEVRKVNRQLIEETIALYLTKSYGEVKEINRSDDKNTLHRIVSSIIVKAVDEGDQVRLNFLLDRAGLPLPKAGLPEEPNYTQILNNIPITNIIHVAADALNRERVSLELPPG